MDTYQKKGFSIQRELILWSSNTFIGFLLAAFLEHAGDFLANQWVNVE